MTPEDVQRYSHPSMARILRAVPMLQWRQCHKCEAIDLYRDNMLPVCKCRECGSPDTRVLTEASRLLHACTEEVK